MRRIIAVLAACIISGGAIAQIVNGGGGGSGAVSSVSGTGGIIVSPNIGDVIVSGGGATLPGGTDGSIQVNNAGTFGGLSISDILDTLGTDQGSILYRNATTWVVLGPGTNGQVFESAGPAANPTWATITPGGTVGSCGTADALAYYAGAGTTVDCLSGVGTAGQFLQSAGAGLPPAWVDGIGVSVTATTPDLVVTPSPGINTFTIGSTNPQNIPTDGGTHSYTIDGTALTGDLARQVILVATFTDVAVPQATGDFGAGAAFQLCNKGAVTATSTTSTINGIAGATGIKLGAGCSDWKSDGTNWGVPIYVPQPATQTGTLYFDDDISWKASQGTGAQVRATSPTITTATLASPTATGTTTLDTTKGGGRIISGTSDTPSALDCGRTLHFTSGSGVTVTMPNDITAECTITFIQEGAGQLTFAAASGAAIHSFDSFTKTAGQWAIVDMILNANAGGASAVYTMAGRGV